MPEKRYYWIKLKESFLDGKAVNYLMSLPNGSDYVMIFLLLCKQTINSHGVLCDEIGSVSMPYTVQKIVRDCKWFDEQTIRKALALFEDMDILQRSFNDLLYIHDFESFVGSETPSAARQRKRRNDNIGCVTMSQKCHTDIEKRNK